MKRKVWLFVALVLIIIAQLTVLSSFFHPFQAQGFTYNNSIVEISKMSYVYGWASITIQAPSGGSLTKVQLPNGTQISVNSPYTFEMKLPRTGDCLCNGGTGLFGTNISIDENQPIAAAIIANVSSFEISTISRSGSSI